VSGRCDGGMTLGGAACGHESVACICGRHVARQECSCGLEGSIDVGLR
jgi:hypothetical protein